MHASGSLRRARARSGSRAASVYKQTTNHTLSYKLNRDGSQRSTGDVRLTIWLVNCAFFAMQHRVNWAVWVNRQLANQTVNWAFVQPALGVLVVTATTTIIIICFGSKRWFDVLVPTYPGCHGNSLSILQAIFQVNLG